MNRTVTASRAGQTGDAGRPEPVAGLASPSSTEEPAVKPLLIYGYLRITDDLEDNDIHQLERGLKKLAEAKSFCLAETCYEYQAGYYGTFYRLTAELKRARIRHIVVPSLDNLSNHPLLRNQLITRLGEAGVRVRVAEPYAKQTASF